MRCALLILWLGAVSASGVQPPLSFSIGPGDVPNNTRTVTFDAWDDDGIVPDDLLISGQPATPTENGGYTTGTLELECPEPNCNDVTGGAGGSGESCAEVYFKFFDGAGNLISEKQVGVKTTCCDCNQAH